VASTSAAITAQTRLGDTSLRHAAAASLFGLTLVLGFSLPFEPVHPLVALGWLDINHLKLLLAATLLAWAVGPTDWPALLKRAWPALLLLGILGMSAVNAPTHRAEAIKFVGRFASGLYALVLIQHVARSPQRRSALLWAIVLGAGLSALLGIGEAVGLGALQPVLALFKLAPTRVGGDLRVSASFQYATIASMFFEMVCPLALVLAATASRRSARVLATVIAAVCAVVVTLTITRAGVVALGVALGAMLAVSWINPRWRNLAVPSLVAAASLALAMIGLALRLPALTTRFSTENDWTWYAATYSVPPSLTINSDTQTVATVNATNIGDAAWTSEGDHRFALAYRWISADGLSQLDLAQMSVDLPHDVSPGETVQLNIPIAAHLPDGTYRLAWGMLQRDVLWFHDRGYPDAETLVQVSGSAPAPDAAVAASPRTDSGFTAAEPVPRSELWGAALRMIEKHPLLGLGPDNFRHAYGSYLGLSIWDERVHANNLYLELLADDGMLGAAAFALVVGWALRRVPLAREVWVVGLCASLTTFFLHGTLDYFLDFTPIYLLFWVVVGLCTSLHVSDA
jgi:O-Antigen ligase